MKKNNYLIVGSGLSGSIMAHELTKRGKSCLVIDKRNHIGGNLYTEMIADITVHKYGAHIFHTSNKIVWDYINSFAEFNRFTNSPVANYKGDLYNLPFNMNTFYKMWGISTPKDALRRIENQRKEVVACIPRNLEEQAISLVGRDIYEKLIKEYSEKQWGKKAIELPALLIKRLPVRFNFDNNYFDDKYQGVPIGGYTPIIEKMLLKCQVLLDTDYFADKDYFDNMSEVVLYTGEIDRFFNYCYGALEYRSLRFETLLLKGEANYQGNAVVNFVDSETLYTRIIEHKHFEFGDQPDTVITKEYPQDFHLGGEPYYPINNNLNNQLYMKYNKLADQQKKVIFCGRLAEYRYYDMHQIVERALSLASVIV